MKTLINKIYMMLLVALAFQQPDAVTMMILPLP